MSILHLKVDHSIAKHFQIMSKLQLLFSDVLLNNHGVGHSGTLCMKDNAN